MPTVRDTPELQAYLRSVGIDPATGRPLQAAQAKPEAPFDLDIDEDAFQKWVTDLADANGWEWFHVTNSRLSKPGFLDLELVKQRLIKAELKKQTGKLDPEQKRWVNLYRKAGIEVYVWRPSAWRDIRKVLTGEKE